MLPCCTGCLVMFLAAAWLVEWTPCTLPLHLSCSMAGSACPLACAGGICLCCLVSLQLRLHFAGCFTPLLELLALPPAVAICQGCHERCPAHCIVTCRRCTTWFTVKLCGSVKVSSTDLIHSCWVPASQLPWEVATEVAADSWSVCTPTYCCVAPHCCESAVQLSNLANSIVLM